MTDLAILSLVWLKSPSYVELTTRQTAILALCCDEGRQRVKGLAARIGAAKPPVTRAHTHLANLGLLRRVPDEIDKRSCYIEATDEGRALRQAMRVLA